ncbi:nucleotide sugar dehydrogenase [Georgenia daeguensis]|uniref:UDP-glucose 6-dehydrogenase n=1 Tax=Georgenia daeguensis TaxID=908355 RepID=A0ABP6UKI8_9MICO
MRVAIVGLGYVGTVTAACLAESGHTVVGVDVSTIKVEQINSGVSPVSELGLSELVENNVDRGRLRATTDGPGTVASSDVVLVTVGTPSGRNGDVHLDDVFKVIGNIGAAIADDDTWRLVLITSTVPPGTVERDLVPLLERTSGKRAGHDFGVAFSPEFLREGTAVADFLSPPKTVIGADDERSAKVAASLYRPFAGEVTRTSIAVAEMVKFSDNAWHALKVAFANEIGRVAEAHGVDSHAVMSIFKSDTRLNISSRYLTPGFAFGGSCLPKDLRTLTYRARRNGASVPVLESILPSNRAHLDLALGKIEAVGAKRVAILGLAFKAGTDDLRESPSLELAERLLGKGYDVRIHDEHVNLRKLIGANRAYVLSVLPHIAEHLDDDFGRVTGEADVIVVTQNNPAYSRVADESRAEQTVLDLCGVARPHNGATNYVGLTW